MKPPGARRPSARTAATSTAQVAPADAPGAAELSASQPTEPALTSSPPHRPAVRGHAVTVIARDAAHTPAQRLAAALDPLQGPPADGDGPSDPLALRRPGPALILLDLGAFAADSPLLPDRALVEALVDRLAAAGVDEVVLASSADSSALWADNREVPVLAELFGYRYETAAGTPYDIVDLGEALAAPAHDAAHDAAPDDTRPPPPHSPWPLARAWVDAGLRIVLARAATDPTEDLLLGCATLFAALPARDKDLVYRLAADPVEVLATLLAQAPPELVLVDLDGMADGAWGRQHPLACAAAHGLVAGRELLAVDAAAAARLGADPARSRLWAGLAARRGVPALDLRAGDLRPLAGVRLPDPRWVAGHRQRDAQPLLARLLPPWLQARDDALFPLHHPLDAKVHAWWSARRPAVDDEPAAKAGLLALNALLATAGAALTAWGQQFDKDGVLRRQAGISAVTLAATPADEDAMAAELDALALWLAEQPPAAEGADVGLRWRRLDGAVAFQVERTLAVPYADFVARVPIERSIGFMADYLGGSIQVRSRDAEGRPLRQVERNLYLPQPTYLGWWGAPPIDVSKIERITRDADGQRMDWKTLASENGSARVDDGRIRFQPEGPDATRVSLVGRQHFTRPPLLAALHLEQWPELEDRLIERAYRDFFHTTFAHFEALLEGRDLAIGRAVPVAGLATLPRPIDTLARLGEAATGLLEPLLARWLDTAAPGKAASASAPRPQAGAGRTDAQGFVHLPGPGGAARPPSAVDAGWLDGLLEALRRDLPAAWARPA